MNKFKYLMRFFTLIILLAIPAAAGAMQEKGGGVKEAAPPSQAQQKDPAGRKAVPPAQPWRLRVSKTAPYLVTLNATKARLTDIAADLGRQLGAPVFLSPVMEKQRVTLEFTKYPLESAIRALAPQPYIDYELSGDYSVQPKPIAIYLQAYNEPQPPENAAVKNNSEVLIIEGNTEEGLDTPAPDAKDQEEKPLTVSFDKNQLTVRARKQPLNVVLYEIANKVGVPFELQYESKELVDVSFSNYTLEQAVRSLSPSVRLYVRTDLSTSEARPLRIVLGPPTKS